MMLAYKYRAYPTQKQQLLLQEQFDIHASIYNKALDVLDTEDEFVSKYDMFMRLTTWKKQSSNRFDKVNAKAAQKTVGRIYRAISGLSAKKKKGKSVGKLRYKPAFSSIEYNQSGFTVGEDAVRLHPIGEIPYKRHRDTEGEIKGVTIKQQGTGEWYISVICDVEEATDITIKDIEDDCVVGIDFNVSNLLTDSDGRIFESLWQRLSDEFERVEREQQKLSRKQRGSNNYQRQKQRVSNAYQRLVNKRNDILHKLSRWYVEKYDCIAVEDIGAEKLSQGKVKYIKEQAWTRFTEFIVYKASQAGVRVEKVNPEYTSQDCSNCGNRERKDLSERRHDCDSCELSTHRDRNSAMNVEIRARENIGQGLSEFTPWETGSTGETHVSLRTVIERGSPTR